MTQPGLPRPLRPVHATRGPVGELLAALEQWANLDRGEPAVGLLADAVAYRTEGVAGQCGDCDTGPAGLCWDHAADVARAEAYQALGRGRARRRGGLVRAALRRAAAPLAGGLGFPARRHPELVDAGLPGRDEQWLAARGRLSPSGRAAVAVQVSPRRAPVGDGARPAAAGPRPDDEYTGNITGGSYEDPSHRAGRRAGGGVRGLRHAAGRRPGVVPLPGLPPGGARG